MLVTNTSFIISGLWRECAARHAKKSNPKPNGIAVVIRNSCWEQLRVCQRAKTQILSNPRETALLPLGVNSLVYRLSKSRSCSLLWTVQRFFFPGKLANLEKRRIATTTDPCLLLGSGWSSREEIRKATVVISPSFCIVFFSRGPVDCGCNLVTGVGKKPNLIQSRPYFFPNKVNILVKTFSNYKFI